MQFSTFSFPSYVQLITSLKDLLRVYLNTTYFIENWKFVAENNKKNNFWITVHSPKYCTFALIHCSYLMNSIWTVKEALVKNKKKKKKKKTKQIADAKRIISIQTHTKYPFGKGYFHQLILLFSLFLLLFMSLTTLFSTCKDSICNDPKFVLGSNVKGPNNKFVDSGLKG